MNVYFILSKLLVHGGTDEDEMEQHELQTTDASIKVKEEKDKKPTIVTRTDVQTDKLVVGESSVIFI